MNVTFVTGDAEKDAAFVKAAAAQGLVNLKGHRTVGGMRASIYNAMPMEGVKKLVRLWLEVPMPIPHACSALRQFHDLLRQVGRQGL